MAGTDWWVVVPVAEKNIQTRPPDAQVYGAQQGSSLDQSWLANNQSPSVTIGNQQFVPLIGPFSSQAEAQSAQVDNSGGSGIVPGIIGGLSGNPAAGLSVPNPFAGIADTAHAIAAIGAFLDDVWKALTDGKMWRSIGWLLLGVLVMLGAVAWWIGPSASRMSPLGILRQNLG